MRNEYPMCIYKPRKEGQAKVYKVVKDEFEHQAQLEEWGIVVKRPTAQTNLSDSIEEVEKMKVGDLRLALIEFGYDYHDLKDLKKEQLKNTLLKELKDRQ